MPLGKAIERFVEVTEKAVESGEVLEKSQPDLC
jgi:hypothetical protein